MHGQNHIILINVIYLFIYDVLFIYSV